MNKIDKHIIIQIAIAILSLFCGIMGFEVAYAKIFNLILALLFITNFTLIAFAIFGNKQIIKPLANIFSALFAGFTLTIGILWLYGSISILLIVFSGILIATSALGLLMFLTSQNNSNKSKMPINNKTSYDEVYENLQKLKSLYESNILTEQEYEEKRKKFTDML